MSDDKQIKRKTLKHKDREADRHTDDHTSKITLEEERNKGVSKDKQTES